MAKVKQVIKYERKRKPIPVLTGIKDVKEVPSLKKSGGRKKQIS